MSNIVPIANAESRPRRAGDFVKTATALGILRSLDLVRSMPDCAKTMISGAPGVGTTKALRHFCASQGYDALYHSIPRGEDRPTAIAEHVLGFLGMDANGMSRALRGKMMAQYVGRAAC